MKKVQLDDEYRVNLTVRVKVDTVKGTAIFTITNNSGQVEEHEIELTDLKDKGKVYPFMQMCSNGA